MVTTDTTWYSNTTEVKVPCIQHEYFNDYNRLYPSVENEGEDEIPDECAGCEDYDDCNHEPVGEFNIYMKHLNPLKENYPHLWNLFYGRY